MRWLSSLFVLLCFSTITLAGTATDFSLRDLANQETRLSNLKGKVVVMSFWATWCGPCKAEMPHLQAMYTKYKDQGLVILGISADKASDRAQVGQVLSGAKVTYPVLLDTESKVVSLYNPSKTLPFTVIVDRAGNLVESHAGYNAGDEVALETRVTELLKQTAP